MTNCGVYQIKNTVTGDYYIGSSCNISNRTTSHKWHLANNTHPNRYLQSSYNKYGKQAFEFKAILLCDIEHKLYYEQCLLDLLKPVYNLATCVAAPMQGLRGELSPIFGRHISEETKLKISASHKGERSYLFGKHHSDETKRKMSEAGKGRVVAEKTRLKLSEINKGELHPMFGKHRTAETKLKLSEFNKGKHLSEEHKHKISEAQIGKHVPSEETLAKMRASHKGKPWSEARRQACRRLQKEG